MTREQIEAVLEDVRSWPSEDQQELVEAAREIEARRKGSYRMTPEEREAVVRAKESPLVLDDEVEAFWKSRNIP
jgi:hypothetical protein